MGLAISCTETAEFLGIVRAQFRLPFKPLEKDGFTFYFCTERIERLRGVLVILPYNMQREVNKVGERGGVFR